MFCRDFISVSSAHQCHLRDFRRSEEIITINLNPILLQKTLKAFRRQLIIISSSLVMRPQELGTNIPELGTSLYMHAAVFHHEESLVPPSTLCLLLTTCQLWFTIYRCTQCNGHSADHYYAHKLVNSRQVPPPTEN